MITNPILEDKWRVQKALSQQADQEAGGYIALTHRKVLEAERRYGLRFRYVESEKNPGDRDAEGTRISRAEVL